MSSVVSRFILINVLVAGSMAAGYLGRRLFGLSERLAHRCMWFVVVIGYSLVGLLAVWTWPLQASDLGLPVLAFVYICGCTLAALGIGRLISRDRQAAGLIGLAGGMGNASFTMGGFLCYVFFGGQGLSLTAIYCLMWYPFVVLVAYPIAHHCTAGHAAPMSLGRLMWRSVWDVRSVGLPLTLAGLALSAARVPRPALIDTLRVTEALTIGTTVLAFFAVGLRLRGEELRLALAPSAVVGAVRFVLCPLIGLGVYHASRLTPWPLGGLAGEVFLVETCLPVAVTVVGIANLFELSPRRATALFILNTLAYLVLCVPVLAWIFAR